MTTLEHVDFLESYLTDHFEETETDAEIMRTPLVYAWAYHYQAPHVSILPVIEDKPPSQILHAMGHWICDSFGEPDVIYAGLFTRVTTLEVTTEQIVEGVEIEIDPKRSPEELLIIGGPLGGPLTLAKRRVYRSTGGEYHLDERVVETHDHTSGRSIIFDGVTMYIWQGVECELGG